MEKSLEATGRTVEEAIQRGLDELELELDDVDVDVLNEGRSGLLGLRSEEARVRLTPRDVDDESDDPSFTSLAQDADRARDILAELITLMGVEAQIEMYVPGSDPARSSEPGEPILLEIEREDAGLLIGRRGQTLRHLQMLLTTIVSRRLGHYVPLRIDVEGYQQRHVYRLEQIALRAADHVRRRRRSITLDPMSAADRRIIHMTLADNRNVVTGSTGQGENRRVTIAQAGSAGGERSDAPRRQAAPTIAPPPPPDDLDDDEYEDDEYVDDLDEDEDDYEDDDEDLEEEDDEEDDDDLDEEDDDDLEDDEDDEEDDDDLEDDEDDEEDDDEEYDDDEDYEDEDEDEEKPQPRN